MDDNTKNKIIKIPKDLYGTELLSFLYPNNYESDEEKQAITLLYKICTIDLINIPEINLINDFNLTDSDKNIIVQNEWNNSENLEVKARCNDVLCCFEKKDKRQIIIKTSDYYISAYKESGDSEFLIRSITVRNIKILNDDTFLSNIFSGLNKIYLEPNQLCLLIAALRKSYPVEKLISIVPFIKQHRNNAILRKRFSHERKYIEALYELKVLNTNDYHKQKALSYEKEADNIIEEMQPNTVYLTIPDIYQKAYNEIFKIRNKEPLIFNRIKEKLIIEKQNFIEILSSYGIKTKTSILDDFKQQIKNHVKKVRLNNFCGTINLFLSIPFETKTAVEKYIKGSRKRGVMPSLFGVSRVDTKGNTIGEKDNEVSLRTEAHIYFREKRLYALTSYFGLHHWANIKTEENKLFYLLEKTKPEFIEEQNIIFWTKGISAGLNNDFIASSHILMPQLERALHNIAEIRHGSLTALEKPRQEAPILGKILPLLKNIIDDEILFEIESFLQSGIDVNFRNNLAHGLLTPSEINQFAIYLLWMCLKLYFDKGMIAHKK